MPISQAIPTFNFSQKNIHVDSGNILNIAKWFSCSPLAQSLTLSKAKEIVAKSCGFKSYAAWQAQNSTYNTASHTDKIKAKKKADQLFIDTINDYLFNAFNMEFDYPVYLPPSPLLLYVIKNHHSEISGYAFNILTAINLLGVQTLRNRYLPYKVNEFNAIHKLSLVSPFLNKFLKIKDVSCFSAYISNKEYMELYLSENEFKKTTPTWFFLKGDDYVELTTVNIDTELLINPLQINKRHIVELLGAKEIINLDFSCSIFDEANRFTLNTNIFTETHATHYDQGYCDGIYIEYFCGIEKQQDCLGVVCAQNLFDLDMKYLDQNNQEQELSIDLIEHSINISFNGDRFEIESEFEYSNSSQKVNDLKKYLNDAIKNHLYKYPLLLANIYTAAYGSFTHEERTSYMENFS
jgi:hypothetical protein